MVATELGHSTTQMLYSTYRELVLPEEAERYWKIVPSHDANNVIALCEAGMRALRGRHETSVL